MLWFKKKKKDDLLGSSFEQSFADIIVIGDKVIQNRYDETVYISIKNKRP